MRFRLAAALVAFVTWSAQAQDLPGFPREDFGKVVLSSRQAFAEKLEGQIGDYNNEPISLYNPRSVFFQRGRPVGRLDVLTNVRVFPCTAFLISDKYLLTNHHCVPGLLDIPEVRDLGATRIESIQLVLGYTREGIEEDAERFNVSPVPVEQDKGLDYAILEVFGRPSDKYSVVTLATEAPYDSQPYFIIGHPLGSSQRISREQCLSAAPAISGGRVLHKCDTLPGNSGSPVFDGDTRNVIALHHAGSSRNSINYAIPLARIVEKSPILRGLAEASGSQNTAVAALDTARPTQPGQQTAPAQPACDGVDVSLGTGGTACIKPGSGQSFRDCPDCPEMVVVPAGSFLMGSPQDEEGRDNDEDDKAGDGGEQRRVTIAQPFAVGKFEATFDEWDACVAAGGCQHKPGDQGWGRGRRPVINVSWDDVTKQYLPWLSQKTGKTYRLLTEAEWEYAARGVTRASARHSRFHFGDDDAALCGYANHADRSTSFSWKNETCSDGIGEKTAEVGQFKPNPFGLRDMHGNVWEWVEDCYADSYANAPRDGSATTLSDCSLRVLRGGSWYFVPLYLRSAYRYWNPPDNRISNGGVRLARTL